jgi:hypothetical protein
MTPTDADNQKNSEKLAIIKSHTTSKMKYKKIKPRFKKNDIVRVSIMKGPYSRSYDIQNTYQRFVVHTVSTFIIYNIHVYYTSVP